MLFRKSKCKEFGYPKKFNKKYSDSDFSQNAILADEVYMSMNTIKTRRNNNVLVIAGSGRGKTRFFVKPNLLQANCSYIIIDPDRNLLDTYGDFLEYEKGYKIKVLDLTNASRSQHYNPFAYIRSEQDVITMIDCLIKNINKCEDDNFIETVEKPLLLACCFYLIESLPKEEQNFANVVKLLECALEGYLESSSALDLLMDSLETKNPESLAVKNYNIFKKATGKFTESALVSVLVKLQVFNFESMRTLTNDDTLDLASFGDEKQALFIIMRPQNDAFHILTSMLYTQAADTLFNRAKSFKNSRLPVHVKFLIDEFDNCGYFLNLNKRLVISRPYNISYTIILQSISQLEAIYGYEWEIIADSCDSFVYLGNVGKSTLDYIDYRLGNRASMPKQSTTPHKKHEEHYFPGTLEPEQWFNGDLLDDNCIVFVRGEKPIYTKKYNPEKHPNSKYTADYYTKLLYGK